MPSPLSDLERRILDYMVEYLQAHTYQPSVREIAERFGIRSTRTVTEHLGALAEKGYVERDPSRSRGVRILGVDLSPTSVALPCFSQIPGPRGGAEADAREGWFSLDRKLGVAEGSYLLRVSHEGWSAFGILEGDLLLVAPVAPAALRPGDLVTLSPASPSEGEPELAQLAPETTSPTSLTSLSSRVTGRVVGLHRQLGERPRGLPLSLTAH